MGVFVILDGLLVSQLTILINGMLGLVVSMTILQLDTDFFYCRLC